MIQSDHPAGKRMRRRRGGANRLINCRRDPPAKVLATRISMSHLVPLLEFNRYGKIAVESLNVQGMVKNDRLARAISDVAWSSFVVVLTHRAERRCLRHCLCACIDVDAVL
jgi:transposase